MKKPSCGYQRGSPKTLKIPKQHYVKYYFPLQKTRKPWKNHFFSNIHECPPGLLLIPNIHPGPRWQSKALFFALGRPPYWSQSGEGGVYMIQHQGCVTSCCEKSVDPTKGNICLEGKYFFSVFCRAKFLAAVLRTLEQALALSSFEHSARITFVIIWRCLDSLSASPRLFDVRVLDTIRWVCLFEEWWTVACEFLGLKSNGRRRIWAPRMVE